MWLTKAHTSQEASTSTSGSSSPSNQDNPDNQFYSFKDYKFVLNTGLNTEKFSTISYQNFIGILDMIDNFYSENIQNNKYSFLIKDNKKIL